MSKPFPTVGIIGGGHLAQMFLSPAKDLGIDVLLLDSHNQDLQAVRNFAAACDVVTFIDQSTPLSVIKSLEADGVVVRPSPNSFCDHEERELLDFDYLITVVVARSPHGQATTWAPTRNVEKDGICVMTVTATSFNSAEISEKAQKIALETANESGVVGVMAVNLYVIGEELLLKKVSIGVHDSGNWTIEGSCTSQFEQHLRAVLDLPLGDPSMRAPIVVTGNVIAGDKPDMYRPYLHLMARTPSLKFHQYKEEVAVNQRVGHITILGEDLKFLQDEITHALDYMCGLIDE